MASRDDSERQLVGQIFCGILALFGILIATVGILITLYADAQGEGPEAYLLWGLIVSMTLAILVSSLTAGCALARMSGYDISLGGIQAMVYLILFIVTVCVVTISVVGLRYL